MKDQQRGLALVILGVVAVIAIVGLVLMFSGAKKSAGAVMTTATGGTDVCPVVEFAKGDRQWTPVLPGPYESHADLVRWEKAGYECIPGLGPSSIDEFGFPVIGCCRNPRGVPVAGRGPTSLETRRKAGVPVGSQYLGNLQYQAPRFKVGS